MKLTTLSVAVAAMVALAHPAQAREHHRRHHALTETWGHHQRYHHQRHYAYRHRHERPSHHFHYAFFESNTDWGAPEYRHSIRHHHAAADRRRYGHHLRLTSYRGEYGSRPAAWCGWEMRHLVSRDPGPAYNLARNWAHWGHGGRAGIGAVVVWPHHVGKIVGRADGEWIIKSGNDGHRLRVRPRSIAGAIAIRWG